ncbi:GNAT family N-acetyltransferase [Muriicola sp. Z0-33]|uniref:GNAT family N-acetyltransferase n=1 Tax=Muriicola sp. Z0-33 TaxID=2816957 RepID=UPI00223832CB|nr:GNAT family N-acetyltransferase [Muriicola sp. Z0-33]MCW5518125.1 GNAT family N-acetyltransferase [Muriicola sp. Z0-33]
MIREYKGADLNKLMNIWQQATTLAHSFLAEEFVKNITKDMRTIYLPDPTAKTYVYEENENILGFISMRENKIAGLFVRPENHSKGIGSSLVNHIKDNYENLEVEVFKNNKIGLAFYDKYGFSKVEEYLFKPAEQVIFKMRYNTKSKRNENKSNFY